MLVVGVLDRLACGEAAAVGLTLTDTGKVMVRPAALAGATYVS
jgi:hypothetical protein